MSTVFKDATIKKDPWVRIPAAIKFTEDVAGGKAMDAEVYLKFLQRKMGITDQDELRRLFVKDLIDAGVMDADDRDIEEVQASMSDEDFRQFLDDAMQKYSNKALIGFFRDRQGLYIQGYQIKAALREATNILYPWHPSGKNEGKWRGKSPRDIIKDMVEIEENKLHLGVPEADDIREITGTVSGAGGKRSVVSRYELVHQPLIEFTVLVSDVVHDSIITPERWARLWRHVEAGGIGSCRKYGYGRLEVVRWGEMVDEEYTTAAA